MIQLEVLKNGLISLEQAVKLALIVGSADYVVGMFI